MLSQTAELRSLRLAAIYCIQNEDAFELYQAQRKAMLRRLGQNANESWLWHGTSLASIQPILSNGFLRDFNRRGAFGSGSYFARQASYSLQPQYSKVEPSGEHYLLLCRVLVGEACVGRQDMDSPLQKPGASGELYESMVDRLPAEAAKIVVLGAGSDRRAYPEFVLKFQDDPRNALGLRW